MAPRLDLHLPAAVHSVGAARHAVRGELESIVDEDTRMDIELLVSELVTNGVRHGPRGDAWIDVRLHLDSHGVTVEVRDSGPGYDPDARPTRDPESAGGWGLTLVDGIADRWGTRTAGRGSTVWFRIERVLEVS